MSDKTNSAEDEGYTIGDLVVGMAEPGPFRVVGLEANRVLVIESPTGTRRRVRDVAVRRVTDAPPVSR